MRGPGKSDDPELNIPVADGWTARRFIRCQDMKVPIIWIEFEKAGQDSRTARFDYGREGRFVDPLPGQPDARQECLIANQIHKVLRL